MDLITKADDERLNRKMLAFASPETVVIHYDDAGWVALILESLRAALEKLRNWEDGWNITDEDVRRVQESKPPNEETMRMALVAVSVVAGANTTHTAEHTRLPKDHPYWTVAHDDVCAAVDREMSLRAEISDATALAYNLDPDKTEPSEMGLCEQINHLGGHLARLRSLAAREEDVEGMVNAILSVSFDREGESWADTVARRVREYLKEGK